MAEGLSDLGFVPQADDLSGLGFVPEQVPTGIEPPQVEFGDLTPEQQKAAVEKQKRLQEEWEAQKGAWETIGEPIAAGLQAFSGATLPFIAGKLEELGGVTRERQLALREAHPVATGIGTVGGIAAGIIATGGAGAAAKAAGATAAEAAALAGAGRAAQAAAAAKAAFTVAPTAAEVGVLPIALASRVGGAIRAGSAAIAPAGTAAGIAARAAGGVAAAATEGTLIATALEADEARLENRAMSGEAIAHAAILSGGIGALVEGVPAGFSLLGKTAAGKAWAARLGDTAAVRVMKKFGATASEILRAKRQIGEARYFSVLNDAERFGLVRPTMSIEKSGELADSMLENSGKVIGAFADEAAARAAEAPSLVPKTSSIVERISDEIVAPLAKTVEGQDTAVKIARRLEDLQALSPDRISVKGLTDLRSDISKTIYGLRGLKDPLSTRESAALRQMRHILTDEISSGLEQSGIDPKAWRVAQRQYEVASRIDDLAEGAQLRKQATTASDVINTIATVTGMRLVAGAAKAAKELTLDWAPMALQRALEGDVPPQMVRDLKKLSDLREQELRAAGTAAQQAAAAVTVPAEEVARRQYLRLHNKIVSAEDLISKNPQMQSPEFSVYREALRDAKKSLEDAYYGKIPKGTKLFHPAAASADFVDNAANVLESVENSLTPLSRLGRGRTMLHSNAVGVIGDVRDAIRQSLANTPTWGDKYNAEAIKRLNESAAMLVNPDRVAVLSDLEKMTRDLQSKATSKTQRLMGVGAQTARRTVEQEDLKARKKLRAVIDASFSRPEETKFGEVEVQPEAER